MATVEEPGAIARPPEPVSVVLALTEPGRRTQLAGWLTADGRFTLLGEAADAGAAVDVAVAGVPDVAFVSLDLPAGASRRGETIADGVRAIATIRQHRPAVTLVAVADADDDLAYAGLAAGAMGCYLWDDPTATAAEVAVGAVRGEGALTPGWAGRILDELRWLERETGPVPAPELTPTELEVVRRVASGASTAAIAELHGVTTHVVDLHAAIAITKVWRHHDDLRQVQALEQR